MQREKLRMLKRIQRQPRKGKEKPKRNYRDIKKGARF